MDDRPTTAGATADILPHLNEVMVGFGFGNVGDVEVGATISSSFVSNSISAHLTCSAPSSGRPFFSQRSGCRVG